MHFANFWQFSARSLAVLQPIWPKLSPYIAPTSPTNPLKFQPDQPRWGPSSKPGRWTKWSQKSRFLIICFLSVTRMYLNRSGRFQKYACLDLAQWSPPKRVEKQSCQNIDPVSLVRIFRSLSSAIFFAKLQKFRNHSKNALP